MTKTKTRFPKAEGTVKFFVKPTGKYKENEIRPSTSNRTVEEFFMKPQELKQMKKDDDNKESHVKTKKPFDKKKYRLQKYSKKYRVQQWEEKRKKAVLRGYYHKIQNEDLQNQFDVKKIYEDNELLPESNKLKTFPNVQEQFLTKKEEKQEKRKELQKQNAERERARIEANKARAERARKFARKTRKGQPIMRYRMEMLLEKIQKGMNK